jgi:ribosomal protein RSM22 (predicted rRNA methylase)
VLIEKGLPRGFEIIADARNQILNFIEHPGTADSLESVDYGDLGQHQRHGRVKEPGMIVAPCTNHMPCPLYKEAGEKRGRQDFCYFTQRYIRPHYLQKIIDATDRNHEDVEFSYLSVQRGQDHRREEHAIGGAKLMQGNEATDKAFEGYELLKLQRSEVDATEGTQFEMQGAQTVNSLSLPRTLFQPIKRRGHVILDVCTPAGTFERWTVPRSFSKQAFRDARKAQWGDLWALGAKTRVPRKTRLGMRRDEYERLKEERRASKRKRVIDVPVGSDGAVQKHGWNVSSNVHYLDRKASRKTKRQERYEQREYTKALEGDDGDDEG